MIAPVRGGSRADGPLDPPIQTPVWQIQLRPDEVEQLRALARHSLTDAGDLISSAAYLELRKKGFAGEVDRWKGLTARGYEWLRCAGLSEPAPKDDPPLVLLGQGRSPKRVSRDVRVTFLVAYGLALVAGIGIGLALAGLL